MTQEEIKNLKEGDCFIRYSVIFKIIKRDNNLIRVLHTGLSGHLLIRGEISIFCNVDLDDAYLCDNDAYDKAIKVLNMATVSIKSIIASSSAIAEKED